jgi:hypothetical protein
VCVCTRGKHYLSKGNTIESELADTGGSTATGAPPLKKKKTETYYVCFCVCPHTTKPRIKCREKSVGKESGNGDVVVGVRCSGYCNVQSLDY